LKKGGAKKIGEHLSTKKKRSRVSDERQSCSSGGRKPKRNTERRTTSKRGGEGTKKKLGFSRESGRNCATRRIGKKKARAG